MRSPTSRPAFTLIELLVVVAIIAILAAILFPVFAKAREKANTNTCMNNTRQICIAFIMWSQDHDETLPRYDNWVNAVGEGGAAGQLLDCPSNREIGSTAKPDYFYIAGIYNGKEQYLSSRALGELGSQDLVPICADLASPDKNLPWITNDQAQNPNMVVTRIGMRHSANIGFLDGHVELKQDKDITGALFGPAMNPNYVVDVPLWLGQITDGFSVVKPGEQIRTLCANYKITRLLCKTGVIGNDPATGTVTTDNGAFPSWLASATAVVVRPNGAKTYYNTLDGFLWNGVNRWALVGNQDYGGGPETSCTLTLTPSSTITMLQSKRMAFLLNVQYSTRTATLNYIKVGATNYPMNKVILATGGNSTATSYQAADAYTIPVLAGKPIEMKMTLNNVSARAGVTIAVEE
ncbi:MAG: prepilin-type N-terminal cleavage/methylation domain-containing protein [Armatimonadota bacterium]